MVHTHLAGSSRLTVRRGGWGAGRSGGLGHVCSLWNPEAGMRAALCGALRTKAAPLSLQNVAPKSLKGP